MANLPRDRITPSKPPFTYVEVDVLGSDQGTSFTIASKEMKGIISDIDEHKVDKFCPQRDTK